MGLISALIFGFLLGVKHALDADHIVTVSTMVSQSKKLSESAFLGIFWGIGHTFTLLLVGLVVLGFRLTIPTRIALSLEFLVGIVLILLGVSVIRAPFLKRIHLHIHSHEETRHIHFHFHFHPEEVHKENRKGHDHSHKSLVVGMIHGLAGSAALMLLVLATADSMFIGLFYILLFGIGSILGMLLLSSLIGLPFVFTAQRFTNLNKVVSLVAGFISIGLGISILAELGFGRKIG